MKKNKIILTIFFALVIILYIITSAAPNLTGALKKTQVLEYGGLQVKDEVTCYIVRNETVYQASRAGEVEYYIEEEQQVRKGVKILNVISDGGSDIESNFPELLKPSQEAGIPYGIPSQNYSSEFTGAISYYLDGYESILNSETMQTVDRTRVESAKFKTENVVRKPNQRAATGDPLYKMIDDNTWYVLFWVPTEDVAKYGVNNSITLNLPLGPIKGKVNSISEDGEAWRITLKFNRYYKEFAQAREIDVEVITSDNKGLIVRNDSIAVKEGQAGLYVKDVIGEYVFKPVNVITSDGEHSLVDVTYFINAEGQQVETVNVYDEILKKPN